MSGWAAATAATSALISAYVWKPFQPVGKSAAAAEAGATSPTGRRIARPSRPAPTRARIDRVMRAAWRVRASADHPPNGHGCDEDDRAPEAARDRARARLAETIH